MDNDDELSGTTDSNSYFFVQENISEYDTYCIDAEDSDIPSDNLLHLTNHSDLKILQEGCVKMAYANNKHLGLFPLFITRHLLAIICQRTNEALIESQQATISEIKFQAYIGLELAMSIIPMNQIRDYWSQEMFLGQEDFKKAMSQNNFLQIWQNIVF